MRVSTFVTRSHVYAYPDAATPNSASVRTFDVEPFDSATVVIFDTHRSGSTTTDVPPGNRSTRFAGRIAPVTFSTTPVAAFMYRRSFASFDVSAGFRLIFAFTSASDTRSREAASTVIWSVCDAVTAPVTAHTFKYGPTSVGTVVAVAVAPDTVTVGFTVEPSGP